MTRMVLLALAFLMIAACGKKGDLLPPPGYENPTNNAPAKQEVHGLLQL